MYNRQGIINIILACKIPEKIANKYYTKFTRPEDREEYIQDMYVEFLSLSDDKLKNMWSQGPQSIPNYFARICLNQLVGHNKDYFTKAYNKRIEYVYENDETPIDNLEESFD